MRRILILSVVFAVIGILAARTAPILAQSPPPGAGRPLNHHGRTHVLPVKSKGPAAQARSEASGCSLGCSPPLVYHGGPVMASSATYAIFWLPSGSHYQPDGNDSAFEGLVSRYFRDVGDSSLYGLLTQYSQNLNGTTVSGGPILNSSSFSAAWVDSSGYEGKGTTSNPLLDSDIQAEVTRALNANNWQPAPNAMFFVFTGLDVQSCIDSTHAACTFFSQTQYCAYHGFGDGTHAPSSAIYANMPDMTECASLIPVSPNGDSHADAVINITSHEHFEAVTDPQLTAWYDDGAYGYEIGDECAWMFGSYGSGGNASLNGNPYIVQQEWNNAASSCALSLVPPGLPGAPNNVSAVAGNASATVSWTAPSSDGGAAITNYTVTSSPGGRTANADRSTTSAVVNGLTNGTIYTFTVAATNESGTGPESPPSNAVTPSATAPGAPMNVSGVAGNAQAVVTWTAPSSNGGSTITGYTVTSSPGDLRASVAGSATSTTVAGLTNGTSYTFTVTATNAVGTGPASSPSDAVTPSATTMLVSGLMSGGIVGGSNQLVALVGGTACTSATLPYRASFTLGVNCGTAGQALTFTVNGAQAGLMVAATGATCAVLNPGASLSGLYVFPNQSWNTNCAAVAGAPTAPGAPSQVKATAGNTQATVNWAAPSNDGGGPITDYTVTSSPGHLVATATASATTATVTGLTNGTSYTFTVTATNAIGTGPASPASNAVTPAPPTAPGAPTSVTATAGNAQATVSWSTPASTGGSPITGFTVTSSPGGVTASASGTATSTTVTGLTNGTSYTFTVTAANAVGSGPASAVSNMVTTSATAPMSLSGSKVSGNICTCNVITAYVGGVACTTTPPLSYNASFSMQAGCGSAGQAITFTVNSSAAGFTAAGGVTCLAFAPGTTITGLQMSTSYTQNSSCATVAGLPTAPGAPSQVKATAGNTQATVNWAAPSNDGGGPITGYTVTSSPGHLLATATASATTATVTGLTNGTSYTFTVTATNAIGTGPTSPASNAVTPAPPTTPGAPTSVTATAGNAQATVSWNTPASTGGSPITGFTVTSSPGGLTASASGTATSTTVTGLTNGTSYTFTVTAANAVGSGPASAVSNMVTTSATAPMSLSGSKVSGNICTCNVITAYVGGVACTTTPPLNYNASFSMQASCGSAGQAITFTVNSSAAGFTAAGGVTCLAFAPGTTITGLQVSTSYTQNSSCATAAVPSGLEEIAANPLEAQDMRALIRLSASGTAETAARRSKSKKDAQND